MKTTEQLTKVKSGWMMLGVLLAVLLGLIMGFFVLLGAFNVIFLLGFIF